MPPYTLRDNCIPTTAKRAVATDANRVPLRQPGVLDPAPLPIRFGELEGFCFDTERHSVRRRLVFYRSFGACRQSIVNWPT
jgi:hypothetical protein